MKNKLSTPAFVIISLGSALLNVFLCYILTELLLDNVFVNVFGSPPSQDFLTYFKFYFSTMWSVLWFVAASMLYEVGYSQIFSVSISLVPLLVTGFSAILVVRLYIGMFPYSTNSRESLNLVGIVSFLVYTCDFILLAITLCIGQYLYPNVIQFQGGVIVLYLIGLLLTLPLLFLTVAIGYVIILAADRAFLTFK